MNYDKYMVAGTCHFLGEPFLKINGIISIHLDKKKFESSYV